jgi:hypothetical protein
LIPENPKFRRINKCVNADFKRVSGLAQGTVSSHSE